MKKIVLVLFAVMIGLSSCRADGRKEIVAVRDIPAAGQQTLATCFADSKVSVVLKESELANGIELNFDRKFRMRIDD